MHTLRLKLNVDDNTAAVLEKRFRILAHISNQIRKKAKMMLSRLEDDKQYQQALDEYIRLKKLNSDDKQIQNDMKRLESRFSIMRITICTTNLINIWKIAEISLMLSYT